jgi:HEPN domain-containing protein
MKEQVDNWLKAAEDDLLLIKEIKDNNNLTNMVAFHAQQAIEKSFKAILEEKTGNVPKMHNLITLREKAEEYIDFEIDQDIFDQLNELYIDSRYPTGLGLMPNGKPSQITALKFQKAAGKIYKMVKQYLKKY